MLPPAPDAAVRILLIEGEAALALDPTQPAAYLLQPVAFESLRAAIEQALRAAPAGPAPAAATGALSPEPVLRLGETIFIRHNYRFVRVPLADILLLQADNNHTLVVTETQKYALRLPLSHLLARLAGSPLVRVHRSYAVNLGRVSSFTEQELTLADQTVPISRQYREGFWRCFGA